MLRNIAISRKKFATERQGNKARCRRLNGNIWPSAVDFGQKCLRAKEPDELVRLQTEFVAQQAQIFAEQTKELGQKIQNATQTAYGTLADAARKTEQSIARSDQSLKRHRSEA